MSERYGAGTPGDPWAQNAFNPSQVPGLKLPTVHRGPQAPKPKNPVPRINELFELQNNLLRALKALRNLEQNPQSEADLRKVKREVQYAYKKIQGFLTVYG